MFDQCVTDDDDFLGTRRARITFTALIVTGVAVFNGLVAGVAALTLLGLLATSGLLAGMEPFAVAWRIAVAVTALELAMIMLWALLAWRRGLGELINTGHTAMPVRPVANAVVGHVSGVLVRMAAAAYVLARQPHGSAAGVVWVILAVASALVIADVLMYRWVRRRNRRYWKLRERRRGQDRSTGDGQAMQQ